MDIAYRVALTATLVALVLMVARLVSRQLAGLLAGAPLITAPALTWLALDRGADAARQAAIGSVASCVVVVAFALAYDRAARRSGPVTAFAVAAATLALVSWPIYQALGGNLPAALVSSLAACTAALAVLSRPQVSAKAPVALSRAPGIAATAILAGTVCGLIALTGPSLDPYLAGALASLPVLGAAAAMAEHASGVLPTRFLRGYVTGLFAGRVRRGFASRCRVASRDAALSSIWAARHRRAIAGSERAGPPADAGCRSIEHPTSSPESAREGRREREARPSRSAGSTTRVRSRALA